MDIKKIMLITFILLAILTIGTVSASDDADFNETLTVDNAYEASIDASLDENAISEDSDELIASSDEDILEDSVTEENLHPWVSGHEPESADWDPWIVNVHGDDIVEDGSIQLAISKDGSVIFTGEKFFVDDYENNDIIWSLDELRDNGVNEVGTYDIALKYVKDDIEIDLGDYTFTLTQFNYNTYEGDIYIEYPFDIIRFWDEGVDVKVYVNGTEILGNGGEDPLRWTLSDLGITEAGDYAITIHAADGDLEDEFTFYINVNDDNNVCRLISNNMGIQSWELDDPVLYLFSPDDMLGNTVTFLINDEEQELEITDAVMSWTLEDLGIEMNEGFDIKVYDGDEEVASTYFDVLGFPDPINVDIWNEDEKGKLYNDYTGSVISVDVPEDKRYGSIIVTVNSENEYSWEVDWEDNYHEWSLADLEITDDGEYNIVVKQVVYDEEETVSEEVLAEGLLNVTTFNNDAFRAVLDKDENVIKVFCPDYADGRIYILVERENEDDEPDFVNEVDYEILDEDKGNWVEWSLDELGFIRDNNYYRFTITVHDSEDEEVYSYSDGHSAEGLEINVWDSEESPLYTDTVGTIIQIRCPEGISGMLDVIVGGEVKYHTKITSENSYEWDLKSLGITQAGDYDITLKLDDETISEFTLNVEDFDNDTFRAQVIGEDEPFYLYLFTPDGAVGTVTFIFKGWDDEIEEEVTRGSLTLELNESYWNKWALIDYYMDYDTDRVDISVEGEDVFVEYKYPSSEGENSFTVNEEEIFSPDDVVIWVYANTTDNDYTINITSGDYTFIRHVAELGDYEFVNGNYKYSITLEDLGMFETINDKSKVTITYEVGDHKSLANRWNPTESYSLEKNDEFIRLHEYEDIRVDLIKIGWVNFEVEDEEYDENNIVYITVPDALNIHETALLNISYGDREIIKSLSDLYSEYNYHHLGVDYYITWDDLDLEGLQGNYVLNISVTADDKQIGSNQFFISFDEEEGWGFDEYAGSISLRFYYGHIGDLEFGQGEASDHIIILNIPKYLDLTEGTIIITDETGEVIFERELSEFGENYKFDDVQSDFYWIADDDFDYSIFKENVPFAISFAYGSVTKVYARGIMEGDELHRITTPEEVADYFKVTLSEGILINGSDNAIIIEATDSANRQSVNIDIGGGYFVVYVNGKKVENLGSLVGYDGETELELYLLQRGSGDGSAKLVIYLSDLNITDNGEYNVRVTHNPERGETSSNIETELFNKNLTLTSNVKVDNVTSDVLTGFGMDPILLYLDTYYGDIDSVTGQITVINAEDEVIFTSNIKDLSSQDGRYYLKYSDFENKNFGHYITVIYGNGNERNGNTIVNTTWKDIDASDFTPVVNVTVDDYYGDFINLDIPDLLNDGQIIITIKFKGNHTTNIPNMDVISDFGSQAVYKFNVADIKANYDTFTLSLSNLGFYEDNGNYDVIVQFTGDGTSTLNVTDSTLKVDFLDDIIISIDETSRYTYELPFASVRVFEPINAYVDLLIDGEIYAHVTHFDDGVITFTSSKTWTPGVHTAEIRVIQSEFGSILNSSSVEFETLTKTSDVDVTVPDNVKENENVIIDVTVPKAGNATIQIGNGAKTVHQLNEGLNHVDLGVLSYGNRTIWIDYNATLDNGDATFFTNSVYVFVGDDGHWLTLPDPLVLNDDNTIKFDFGEGATGNVSIYIDDKFIANRTLVNGAAEFVVTEEIFSENYQGELLGAAGDITTKYGKHTYRIVYTGDATHEGLTREGEFTVAYIFKDDLIDEYPLKESYDITVTLPSDATATVTITINNKPYTSQVKDGKATFKVTDLPMGAHEVFIEYSGDENYPYANYTAILNVSYYAVVGEYSDDEKYISLMLPEDATGNLTVYNDNMRVVLDSKQISGGKIKIDLNDLPVGIYDIMAYYEGSDYDVRSFTTSFRVMPKVNILQGVVMGDDGNIYLDLDEATGHIVIAMDGLSPVVQEITNGIVNYTFSTEGYFYGNHSVTFLYFGKSFDGDIFYELDGKTPVSYDLLVLPQNTTGQAISNNDILEVRILREDGSLATDANEFVTFYVNGMKYAVVQVYEGIAKLDISKFKNGNYLISWTYSGNNKYASSSGQTNVVVNHRIVASAASVLYSANKKYSVTVYNSNKGLAKGVKVTFLINNKMFKTVTTNSKGIASVVITQTPGNYKITAKYGSVSTTKTLKVKHVVSLKKIKVKRSAKKLVIKATLKKVNGKYLKSKKVTFKFKGKKYTAKTNKKGVAKVTIKSKVLKKLKVGKKVKYQVTYKKDTVKKTVKVKK